MDNRRYSLIVSDALHSENIYFTQGIEQFIMDYVHGTIKDYSISNFFNKNSDYVTSVKYIPLDIKKFTMDGTLQPTAQILLGKNAITNYNNFYELQSSAITSSLLPKIQFFTLTIPRNHNNFLDFNPYTRIRLYVPYFEMIELNPELVYNKSITAYVSLDVFTGMFTLYIERDEDKLLIETRTVNVGIDISLGRTNAEEISRNNTLRAISTIGSLIGTGVGVASGNPLITAGGIGALTKNVTGALSDNIHNLKSYKGGSGDRTELVCDKNVKLIVETVKNVKEINTFLKGLPSHFNDQLSNVTGYTEIGEIHFHPSDELINDDEITEIIELLRSGIIL